MQYFLLVQDGLTDNDVAVRGPFDSLLETKSEAVSEFEGEPGRILTVLSQDVSGTFSQSKQAVIPGGIVWK